MACALLSTLTSLTSQRQQGTPDAPMCGFSNMACRVLDAYGEQERRRCFIMQLLPCCLHRFSGGPPPLSHPAPMSHVASKKTPARHHHPCRPPPPPTTPATQASSTAQATCWRMRGSGKASRSSQTGPRSLRCACLGVCGARGSAA